MEKYYNYYQISDLVFEVMSPFGFERETEENRDFAISEKEPDFRLEFIPTKDITIYLKKNLVKMYEGGWCDLYLSDDGTEYCFYIVDGYYIAVNLYRPNKDNAIVFYLNEEILQQRIKRGISLLTYVRLETILMNYQKFILHSCHIQYGEVSILFSAPSGTGKSTQGNLWNQNMGAEIVNGDRTIIGRRDNVWWAYGIPMSGTSGISINKQRRLGAIVILRQGKQNNIQKINGLKAFRYIYSEITLNTWNQNFVNEIVELISDLIIKVPIYYFECTKENEAVYVLERQLSKDGVL